MRLSYDLFSAQQEVIPISIPKEVAAVVYSKHRESCECTACGRYLGALEVCPYCRSFNRKRLPVFLLKYLSPILTVIGLVILFKVGAARGSAQVDIIRLGRRYNFAQIELAGRITRSPRFFAADTSGVPGRGTLEFTVDDGTGTIDVRAYDDAAVDLARIGVTPSMGDTVRVQGSYQFRIKEDFIIMGAAQALEVTPPITQSVDSLAEVLEPGGADLKGRSLRLKGRVRSGGARRYEYEIFLVDEQKNEVRLALDLGILRYHGFMVGDSLRWPGEPRKGQILRARGLLDWDRYNKSWYLAVGSPDHLETVEGDA